MRLRTGWRQLPSTNKSKRKLLMRTSYFGQMAELDGQGRVLLPSILRDKALLKGDVAVLGTLDYLEVMNDARVVDQMEKEPYTDEDERYWAIWGFDGFWAAGCFLTGIGHRSGRVGQTGKRNWAHWYTTRR